MWFSCKNNLDTFPNRIKLMLKAMAIVAIVLYITLVLCQNVHGYQNIKVKWFVNIFIFILVLRIMYFFSIFCRKDFMEKLLFSFFLGNIFIFEWFKSWILCFVLFIGFMISRKIEKCFFQ